MKILWFISSLVTIFLILINNPKSEGLGGMGNQSQLFSYTRSTQNNLLGFTLLSSFAFVLLTIILTSHLKM
uniref:Probable protein-export membrane protein SecG n=1 Tax=Synarthrophyton chejuense TaxID=2485825 RepID=A0A3G3MFZ8_9FLOR|nr:preprotein translocase subunit G [Synarthrophyton chejuense]AYR05751.1 preprotein translocase subunit G [Synarthrophyton chejuense]